MHKNHKNVMKRIFFTSEKQHRFSRKKVPKQEYLKHHGFFYKLAVFLKISKGKWLYPLQFVDNGRNLGGFLWVALPAITTPLPIQYRYNTGGCGEKRLSTTTFVIFFETLLGVDLPAITTPLPIQYRYTGECGDVGFHRNLFWSFSKCQILISPIKWGGGIYIIQYR
jgi:hypothetical protein